MAFRKRGGGGGGGGAHKQLIYNLKQDCLGSPPCYFTACLELSSTIDYCDLRSSLRRAVSKRTFAVSKRMFAVSKQTVLTGLMLSFNNEIDTLSRFERNVWLLYSK